MARDRLTFRQRDLAAALRAAKEAGVPVKRIEVRKDAVIIIPGEPETGPEPETEDAEILRYQKEAHDAKI